jgi:hypothetical protein
MVDARAGLGAGAPHHACTRTRPRPRARPCTPRLPPRAAGQGAVPWLCRAFPGSAGRARGALARAPALLPLPRKSRSGSGTSG